MSWKYNLSEVLEIPEGYTHFVYLITDNNTKKNLCWLQVFFFNYKKEVWQKEANACYRQKAKDLRKSY